MKEMVRMVNKQKDSEEKIYLVCLAFTSITNENTMWNIVVGRKAARDLIKDNIDFIDFDESFILVEGCTLEQRKSIYAFIKHIEQFFTDDPFDIDEYIRENYSEYNNDIVDDSVSIDNSERINMESIMNGETSFANEEE